MTATSVNTCLWVPCRTVEANLENYKVGRKKIQWEMREIPIEDLKIEESKANNARFHEEIDDDHVERIAIAMNAGKPLPLIICTPDGFILSGNHRVAAAVINDYTHVMAYVVLNGTPEVHDEIARTSNADAGKPLTEEQLLEQAAYLVIGHGKPISEAATALNLPYNRVKPLVDAMRVRNELEDAGLNSASLHNDQLLSIKKIESKRVRHEFAATAIDAKLNTKQTRDLYTSVTKCDTERQQLAAIKDWRAQIIAPVRKHRKNRDKIMDLVVNTNGLLHFLTKGNGGKPFTDIEQIEFMGDDEIKEFKKAWDAAKRQLTTLLNDYRKKRKVK